MLPDGNPRENPQEGDEQSDSPMQTGDVGMDVDGRTAPRDPHPEPTALATKATDAKWGYRTGKEGGVEFGFGYHQHAIVRVRAPDTADEDPLCIDGVVITPANADVVEDSLRLIRRIKERAPGFKYLLGDRLYTNLRADRWAVPLARELGIQQHLRMGKRNNGIVDIHGAKMQFAWLYCPAAPMDQRPIPPMQASDEEWERIHQETEEFHARWAFVRKESGLGQVSLLSGSARDRRQGRVPRTWAAQRAGRHQQGSTRHNASRGLAQPQVLY